MTIQTSVRRLRHPVTATTIVLVSTHHMSSAGYFRGLEGELIDADVVLNEGRNDDGFTRAEAAPDLLWIARYQAAAVRCGGLVLQPFWEARIADQRWRSVDLPLREISAAAEKEDVFGITEDFKAQVRSMEGWTRDQSPEARSRERAWVVRNIVDEPLQDSAASSSKLDARRENVVFEELRRLVRAGRHRVIALIYGAWHTRRLEPRITRELGYRLYATTWHDALSYVYTPKEQAKPAK